MTKTTTITVSYEDSSYLPGYDCFIYTGDIWDAAPAWATDYQIVSASFAYPGRIGRQGSPGDQKGTVTVRWFGAEE